MSGRDQVLSAVRRALRTRSHGGAARDTLERRLNEHPRGPIPARSDLDHGAQVDLFQKMAEEVQATVVRLGALDEVPKALADYLSQHNLPAEVVIASDPEIRDLDWQGRAPMLTVSEGVGVEETAVSLTPAFGGVAETGTLMLHSGETRPTTLNFLPDTHVVVLKAGDIAGTYEDLWDRVREAYGPGVLPRTVNFITGPSRTGDIEQTIQLGAHGPRRLHILLVEDGPAQGGDGGDEPGGSDGA